MFLIIGLKDHKGFLSPDSNIQNMSAEITQLLVFKFSHYIFILLFKVLSTRVSQ